MSHFLLHNIKTCKNDTKSIFIAINLYDTARLNYFQQPCKKKYSLKGGIRFVFFIFIKKIMLSFFKYHSVTIKNITYKTDTSYLFFKHNKKSCILSFEIKIKKSPGPKAYN